jgi:hypothetical protein
MIWSLLSYLGLISEAGRKEFGQNLETICLLSTSQANVKKCFQRKYTPYSTVSQ